jgi:glutamate---cysteine ligase / carboxylate-amine ligase
MPNQDLLTEHGEAQGDTVRPEMVRADLGSALAEAGLRMACAGTHPFSRWQEQLITEMDRYKMLEDEIQDVVNSMPIFGLDVQVVIPDWEPGIEVMNESRYFLSHLLALSSSSPFWAGRDTGLKSYSSVIWSSFPRTGIPPDFVSNDEYDNHLGSRNAVEHVNTMLRDGTSADRQLDAHRGHA